MTKISSRGSTFFFVVKGTNAVKPFSECDEAWRWRPARFQTHGVRTQAPAPARTCRWVLDNALVEEGVASSAQAHVGLVRKRHVTCRTLYSETNIVVLLENEHLSFLHKKVEQTKNVFILRNISRNEITSLVWKRPSSFRDDNDC